MLDLHHLCLFSLQTLGQTSWRPSQGGTHKREDLVFSLVCPLPLHHTSPYHGIP